MECVFSIRCCGARRVQSGASITLKDLGLQVQYRTVGWLVSTRPAELIEPYRL